MEKLYLVLVDTPGFFAGIIRRVIGINYCHVVLSLDSNLEYAYSFNRRDPAIPLFAGFVRENTRKILRQYPDARYKVVSISCREEQKENIREILEACYQSRYSLRYSIIGLPFLALNRPFHQENHYVCSTFIARLLADNGIRLFDKHFSTVTPRDFYELKGVQVEYEGHPEWQSLYGKRGLHMARKHRVSLLILIILVVMTAFMLLQANDIDAVFSAVRRFSTAWLILGTGTSLLFVALEGVMIWYLMHPVRREVHLHKCIGWSFAGFFFSGITPSASGGQPMQVYYMKNAGIPVSESSPVLMIVAMLYKLVIFLIGGLLWLFCRDSLADCLGSFFWLFYVGLALNAVVVVLLVLVMLHPLLVQNIVLGIERLLTALRIFPDSGERAARLTGAVLEYRNVVRYFRNNPRKVLAAAGLTFIQRLLPFLLSWIVYRGMGLTAMGIFPLMALQAAVTIAVDLLPFPGSAGITELVAASAFASIFPGERLTAYLCISRGIGFYMILLAGVAAVVWMELRQKRGHPD